MMPALLANRDEIARLCRANGVSRLQIFGSATTDRFDPETSDFDFLVEFVTSGADAFDAYFGLKEELERLLGRRVDLVMSTALRNPYFAESASRSAEELYAA